MKAGLQTDVEGHVSRMLSETLLSPEIQAQLRKAIVEIVAEANLTPLGGDEPQDVEEIKNEAVDMRAKSHWIFHGVAEDVRTDEIRDPTGAEITLKNLTRGVAGSAPEFRDLDNTDAGKKAFLVLASVRALLLSGVNRKVSARGYHEIMKVLLQRPDGQELRGLIENKIVNALSDAITESADANLVTGVVSISDSLRTAGSDINMLSVIQRKVQARMARLRAESDAVEKAQHTIQEATVVAPDTVDLGAKVIEAISEPLQPSGAVEKALELLAGLSSKEKQEVLDSLRTET
jgi:hypothetical protein